jgi:eukaryotic-like serine/threonine-protein kinase
MTRATELAPGTELDGTYRIVELLGEGGMGAVYVAELVRLPKRVALKVLHVAADEGAKARFRREAEIAAKVRHPRIVEVLDYNFLEDGSPYLVMELLEGHDLRHRLTEGPIPPDEALAILRDAASALERLHEIGIVHRDLKPENIFLAREGDEVRAKVLDFGISKLMDGGTALTADRSVLGTPAYMAPEQVTGENTSLDPRTDQFALAAVAYEMLTGQPAFQGDNVMQLFHRILTDPAPSITGDHTRTPADEVLARAMSKAKDERYADVRAFVNALGETLGGGVSRSSNVDVMAQTVASGEITAAPIPTPTAPDPTADTGRPPRRALWAAVAILAIAIVATAAILTTGRSESADTADALAGADPATPPDDAPAAGGSQDESPSPAHDTAPTVAPDPHADRARAPNTHRERARDRDTAPAPTPTVDTSSDDKPDTDGKTDTDNEPATDGKADTDTPTATDPPPASKRPSPARRQPAGQPADADAQSRLREAEAALAAGDPASAIRLARQSLQAERSMAAQSTLAKAHCAQRDLGLAKAMARPLRGVPLRDAKRYCRTQGIDL